MLLPLRPSTGDGGKLPFAKLLSPTAGPNNLCLGTSIASYPFALVGAA